MLRKLHEKDALYKWRLNDHLNRDGFILYHECDSLLFSSLLACATNGHFNPWAAFKDGYWYRRPTYYPPCCTLTEYSTIQRLAIIAKERAFWSQDGIKLALEQGSSTISRDMLLGLAYYCYYRKDLKAAESVIACAFKNFGVMGIGSLSRTMMTPALLGTFALICKSLGSRKYSLLAKIPFNGSTKAIGFQAHLTVLHGLLRDELEGTNRTALYQHHFERMPINALFAIAAGKLEHAQVLLSYEKHFPADRLPTSADRHEGYLFQRDFGDDWQPSDKRKEHTGADYIFAYWLLKKRLK
jgi:hypothetical protein